jgi:AbrB family looped-hinge helix DNA binding protein
MGGQVMATTKLSSKGQIIIPKALREVYDWQAGLEFMVIDTGDGILFKPLQTFAPTTLEQVAGCLAYEGPSKSVDEMDSAVRQGVLEAWHDRS